MTPEKKSRKSPKKTPAKTAKSTFDFSLLFEAAPDGILVIDHDRRIILVNTQLEKLFGYSHGELVGKSHDILVPRRFQKRHRQGMVDYFSKPFSQPMGSGMELYGLHRNGDEFPVDVSLSPIETSSGTQAIAIVRDISGRLQKELELRRLNRALKTLSACNGQLVHEQAEDVLLNSVCRIIVQIGDYRLAWVGIIEQTPKKIRPVAWFGYEGGYLKDLKLGWSGGLHRGPIVEAIQTGETVIVKNIMTDARNIPWRAQAIERGYNSLISLPLIEDSNVFGALNIYAAEPDAFDQKEVKLLSQLTADLSFGISAIRTRLKRRHAEEELRIKDIAVESSINFIAFADLEGRLRYVNAAFLKIWGYDDRNQVIGKHATEIIGSDAANKIIPTMIKDGFWRGELSIDKKDGLSTDIELSANLVIDNGKPVCMMASGIDITDRRRAEEHKKRLIDILEATPDLIGIAEENNKIFYLNKQGRKMVGLKEDEDIRNFSIDEFHPDWAYKMIAEEGIPVAISRGFWRGETAVLTRDKKEIPVSQIILTHKKPDGTLAYISTIARDITERKLAEKKLRKSEEYYRSLIENSTDIVLILNPDGTIRFVSPSVEVILGYKPQDLVNKSAFGLIHPEDLNKIRDTILQSLENPDFSTTTECRIRHKKGLWKFLESNGKNLVDKTGVTGIIVNMRDITDRKRIEDQLQEKTRLSFRQNKITADFLNILEITSNSMNFNESINKLLPAIKDLLQSDYCLIYLSDDKNVYKPAYQSGLSRENSAYFLSSAPKQPGELLTRSLDSIEYISDMSMFKPLLPNYMQRLLTEQIKAKSLLMIPVAYNKKTKAVLICPYLSNKSFSKLDKEIAVKIRQHLEAFHIAHEYTINLLHKTMELTEQLEMVEAMSGIDRAILTSSREEEVICGAIGLLGKSITSEVIEILKFDKVNQVFRLSAVQEEEQTYLNLDQSFNENQIKSWASCVFGIPSYYPNLSDEDILDEYEQRIMDKNCKSLLVLPLISKGDLLGLIAFGNKKAASYAPGQLKVAERLSNQIAVTLSNADLIQQLQDMLVGIVNSLVTALDAKSPWTKGHSRRVSDTAEKIGNILGLNEDELYELRLAALFHDIGKIGTYDIVLDKKDKLSEKELAIIKKHPSKTYEILSSIERLKSIAVIAKHHHERWDGYGYPDGLAGDDIPYFSRIITVADTFDAMTSDRPYRNALSREEAIGEFSKLAGVQFDPEIASVFIDFLKSVSGKKWTGRDRINKKLRKKAA